MPDARPKVHPSMHGNHHCPIQSPLKSVLGVRSSYVECKYAFPLLRKCFSLHKHMPQCKFSLYLKKAGLASQNIVHVFKKLFYVVSSCIGLCFYYHLYLFSRSDQPLIQRIPAGLSSTVACLDITQRRGPERNVPKSHHPPQPPHLPVNWPL